MFRDSKDLAPDGLFSGLPKAYYKKTGDSAAGKSTS
jgi:hypothetical protein